MALKPFWLHDRVCVDWIEMSGDLVCIKTGQVYIPCIGNIFISISSR